MGSKVIAAARSTDEPRRRICLMGIPLDNLTLTEAVCEIVQALEGDRPRRACFVNADCVNLARRHADYRETLRTADLVFADGIGMRLAGIILGRRVRGNVNGTDLFPRLCEVLDGRGKRIFLLGARHGTAERLAAWMAGRYPGIVVAGCRDGYFPPADEADVIEQVRRSRSDLLLVAFGAPRQDVWVGQHLAELGVKVAVGVGGLFDFFSGASPARRSGSADSAWNGATGSTRSPGGLPGGTSWVTRFSSPACCASGSRAGIRGTTPAPAATNLRGLPLRAAGKRVSVLM